jgi:formylglycine-generating enzyme required for sulfatase activity
MVVRERKIGPIGVAFGDPQGAASRVPRKASTEGAYWPLEDGRYVLPNSAWAEQAGSGAESSGRRLDMSKSWWEDDWPVFGVSWQDVMAYAAWRTQTRGFAFSLPLDAQWEKAARGPDGRLHPWGFEEEPLYYSNFLSFTDGMRPVGVGAFPTDESPYGVRGLGGNGRDFCLDGPGEEYPGMRLARGGYWAQGGLNSRVTCRTACTAVQVNYFLTGRLACVPQFDSVLEC